MAQAHTEDMLRVCGGRTVSEGQSFVKINGKKWAVEDDPNDHGEGKLIPSQSFVKINGKAVIMHPGEAEGDLLGHLPSTTKTDEGSGFVNVG